MNTKIFFTAFTLAALCLSTTTHAMMCKTKPNLRHYVSLYQQVRHLCPGDRSHYEPYENELQGDRAHYETTSAQLQRIARQREEEAARLKAIKTENEQTNKKEIRQAFKQFEQARDARLNALMQDLHKELDSVANKYCLRSTHICEEEKNKLAAQLAEIIMRQCDSKS